MLILYIYAPGPVFRSAQVPMGVDREPNPCFISFPSRLVPIALGVIMIIFIFSLHIVLLVIKKSKYRVHMYYVCNPQIKLLLLFVYTHAYFGDFLNLCQTRHKDISVTRPLPPATFALKLD